MTKYISIDPGDTSGWATFDEKGDLIQMGSTHSDKDLTDVLDTTKPTLVVCEDWITVGHKTFGGDKMNTARLIGKIEFWCELNGVKMVKQPASVKPIAYLWAGMKKPKNHAVSHEPDAYVHGVYYLQKAGVRKPQQAKGT